MPASLRRHRRPHAGIDESPGSLEALLELSARQEAEGLGDAPWPPHYAKQAGEPPRVQPSKRRAGRSRAAARAAKPLIEIARAKKKADALAGLERWKARLRNRRAPRGGRRPGRRDARTLLDLDPRAREPRARAEALRPAQEPLDPDYDP